MDIDLLSKMVKELILDSDRVVLPGLGAFVAEIVPSTFSDKGYTINPPYRRLSFRSRPDEGSELAELYAKGNKVEMPVAEKIIRDFVAELKSVLHTRKLVVLPGLGRLRATRENTVFFIADEDLDIYPAGFGLEPVSLKTHQETPEEVAAAVGELKSILAGPEAVPVPEVMPEPAPEIKPEIRIEPISDSEVLPSDKPDAPAEPTAEPEIHVKKGKSDSRRTLPAILGIIIVLALLLLAAVAIVGRTNPELIDRFLYTEEELKILNQTL